MPPKSPTQPPVEGEAGASTDAPSFPSEEISVSELEAIPTQASAPLGEDDSGPTVIRGTPETEASATEGNTAATDSLAPVKTTAGLPSPPSPPKRTIKPPAPATTAKATASNRPAKPNSVPVPPRLRNDSAPKRIPRPSAAQGVKALRASTTSPAASSAPPLSPEAKRAKRLIEELEGMLALESAPKRTARLHYEIALRTEMMLGDLGGAETHYTEALQRFSEFIPAIRGLRRVRLSRGAYAEALALFDAEARLRSDTKDKATLYLLKGRTLAEKLGDATGGAKEYQRALELDPTSLSNLKALEAHHHATKDWLPLSANLERQANLIADDPTLRSAIIERRALLVERQLKQDEASIELYEIALKLNRYAPRSLAALKRLHRKAHRWQDLIRLHGLEAELAKDARVQTMAFYSIARLQSERLGNLQDAVTALERAIQLTPRDTLVLSELARLYEATDRYDALVVVLQLLVEVLSHTDERLTLLHRMGQVYEERLSQDDSAAFCYEAALALTPTFGPALAALGKLHTRRQNWKGLIQMHLGEAEHAVDEKVRATAYTRIADLYERKLESPQRAVEYNRRALTVLASHESAFKNLVRLYCEAGDWRPLVELYELALERTQQRALRIALLLKVAQVYEDNLGDSAAALRTHQRILAVDAKHLVAIQAIQRCGERAGLHAEQVEALELEAKLTEDLQVQIDLLQRAAEIVDERMGDREGAIERYKRVIALDESYRPALTGLARIYYRSGFWNDLLDIYKLELKAESQKREQLSLLFKMAELCERRIGDDELALGFYREAVTLDPRFKTALSALGRRLTAKGRWQEVVKLLQLEYDAHEQASERARCAFRLGEVCEEHLDDPARAEHAYEQALTACPDYRPALDALLRLHAQRAEWRKYVACLDRELKISEDERIHASALMRQADVLTGPLASPTEAVARVEAAHALGVPQLSSLHALEELYRRLERQDALATTYEGLRQATEHIAAQISALRSYAAEAPELEAAARIRCYLEVLNRDDADFEAIQALEGLATTTRDLDTLVVVDKHLTRREEDPVTAAAYHARLGESLELQGAEAAITAYKAAIASDPDNYGAVRGFARMAQLKGEPQLLSEAARREAALIRDSQKAAELLLVSARVRETQLEDISGAQEDLEKALEFKPSHLEVASELSRIMRQLHRYDALSQLLADAASNVTSSARAAALWNEVATLKAEFLSDIPAAIACLRRALGLQPDDAHMLLRLAELYEQDSQPVEATKLLKMLIVSPQAENPQRLTAQLKLAQLYAGPLRQPATALEALQAALHLDDENVDALDALARFYGDRGERQAAAQILSRLISSSRKSRPERLPSAYVELVELHLDLGDADAGIHQLSQGFADVGPEAALFELAYAQRENRGVIDASLRGLQHYLKQARGEARIRAQVAYAQLLADGRNALEDAITMLEQAVKASDRQRPELELALADYLRRARHSTRAVDAYRRILDRDPFNLQAWKALSRTFGESKRAQDTRVAVQALVALDAATRAQVELLSGAPTPLDQCEPGALLGPMLAKLGSFSADERRALECIRLIAPALPKLYPPDLEAFGLSSRDRIPAKTEHPSRALAERVAAIFGVTDFDFYVHRVRMRGVSVEMGAPTSLVVPANLQERPFATQVFLLAQPLVLVAQDLFGMAKLTPRELEVLLAAASRTIDGSFGAGLTSEDFLDEQSRRISRALPRRNRKSLEEALPGYIAGPRLDMQHLATWTTQLATRVAALIAGDLSRVLEVVVEGGDSSAKALSESPAAVDLLRYWCSDEALRLRRRLGISDSAPTPGE